MAKKSDIVELFKQIDNIEIRNIADMCTEDMQRYAANMKYMRFVPGIVDGLKPGERRIMFALLRKKLFPKEDHTKSTEGVSETILMHPHGDSPIYETLVRLTQPWENNQPLIDGQGGFGTPTGDSASASRYTELRMSEYAYKCFFEDFNIDYVDSKMNYLNKFLEPEYLPAKYPNVLINNTFGVGYAVSTGLPPFNTEEVLKLTINLLNDPDHEDITLIPDSPTWADVVDEGKFKELCETGKGQFKLRGVVEVDEEKNVIIIRSTPIHVTANKVKAALINLKNSNKVSGILDFHEYAGAQTTSPSGFEMHIILKKEVDPYAIVDLMYKDITIRMQKSIPVNFKLIDEYRDVNFNMRSLILSWLDYRRDYKRRVLNHKLVKAMERKHVLETILKIFTGKNAEKALSVIRNAESGAEIRAFIMKEFDISSLQAEKISEMRLSAFSKESIAKYIKEKDDVDKKVESYNKMIRSNKKIDKEIQDELEEGIRLFGGPRRSNIITVTGERKIRDTSHIIVFTRDGKLKKLPADVKGIGSIAQGDHPTDILTDISNLTELLIFDNTGMMYRLPVHSIPNTELSSMGQPVSSLCKLRGTIRSVLLKPELASLDKIKAPVYYLMITRSGIIKKSLVKDYMNIKSELTGIVIKNDDALQSVKMIVGEPEVFVYTNKGFAVRFVTDTIRPTSRTSMGVKAINMTDNEVVVGMEIMDKKDKSIFILSNKGTGKRSSLDTFKTMDRASKPLRITALEEDEEVLIMKPIKGKEKFKVFLKTSVEEIDVADVPELARLSKGRKLIPVGRGNNIIDIKEVK